METKELIKWGAIGLGAYFVYVHIIAPMLAATPVASDTSSNTPTQTGVVTGTNNTGNTVSTSGGNTTGSNSTSGSKAPAPAPTPVAVDATFTSSDYGTSTWVNRVVSALNNVAVSSGGGSFNLDGWSYFYQNSIGGSAISPALFDGIIAHTASQDRTSIVSAADFVNALVAAKTAGLGHVHPLAGGLGYFAFTS